MTLREKLKSMDGDREVTVVEWPLENYDYSRDEKYMLAKNALKRYKEEYLDREVLFSVDQKSPNEYEWTDIYLKNIKD